MQGLALPRPTSLLPAPFGHPSEPDNGLAKLRSRFSPTRPEQQGYPSPPMSEPQSPSRRCAQTSEPSRHSYHAPASGLQRHDTNLPLPPPSSALFDPRSTLSSPGSSHQRQLYPGDAHLRSQPLHYAPGRAVEHSSYGHGQGAQPYGYGYPSLGGPPYAGAHYARPMAQQTTMIAPPAARSTKPARRTKAHVASACVNCKKAHLSCDVQRPCGRCIASGKQVSFPLLRLWCKTCALH
jgi:hypothetical protein